MRRPAIVHTTFALLLGTLVVARLCPHRAHADEAPPPLEMIEILTGGASAEDALPIVVAVHGLGDNPRHFSGIFEAFPERARIVLPRGPDRRGLGGFSWFPIPIMGVGRGDLVVGIERARDRLAALLERLAKEHPEAGRPVLTGFSQGGILSFAVGVTRPELVARVVPIAGWLPPALVPGRDATPSRVPIRALHGGDDQLLPSGATERLVETLSGRGWNASLRVFPGVPHTIPDEVRDALYAELSAGIDAARAASTARIRRPTSRIVASGTSRPIAVAVIISTPSSP